MKKLLIIITLLIIVVIFAGIFALYSVSLTSKYKEIVYFEIRQDEDANSIARKLELQGLIINANYRLTALPMFNNNNNLPFDSFNNFNDEFNKIINEIE